MGKGIEYGTAFTRNSRWKNLVWKRHIIIKKGYSKVSIKQMYEMFNNCNDVWQNRRTSDPYK